MSLRTVFKFQVPKKPEKVVKPGDVQARDTFLCGVSLGIIGANVALGSRRRGGLTYARGRIMRYGHRSAPS